MTKTEQWIENQKHLTDEEFVRSLFDGIGFRSRTGSYSVRFYYRFLLKPVNVYMAASMDVVSESPEGAWRQLRAWAEEHLIYSGENEDRYFSFRRK